MATKFDFKKSPDVNGTADKTTLYPKIVVAGTKNLENIADDIAKRSGFKAGTVIGLFSDLENLLTDYLADGYNVKEVCRKGEMELERADPAYGFKTSSPKHTQEERFGMLMEYLKEYTFITRQEYSNLTGVLKTKAAHELRQWFMEDKIKRSGRVPHVIYMAVGTE